MRLVDDLRLLLGGEDAVWYDARGGLHGGDAWWSKIERELMARAIFLVVFSPDAVTSAWVNDEIDIAWRRKNHPDPTNRMRLIPVFHRSCTIRPGLESLQIVSFLPPKTYEEALRELLTALGLPLQAAPEQRTPSAPQNSPVVRVLNQNVAVSRPHVPRLQRGELPKWKNVLIVAQKLGLERISV